MACRNSVVLLVSKLCSNLQSLKPCGKGDDYVFIIKYYLLLKIANCFLVDYTILIQISFDHYWRKCIKNNIVVGSEWGGGGREGQ